MTSYCVRITHSDGPVPVSYLSVNGRSEWSLRQAQRHAADVRAGRTGIRNAIRVEVIEA